MKNFRASLFYEYAELTKNMDDLYDFIVSTQYDELPEIDRKDMKEQLEYMRAYHSVLSRRVARGLSA